MMNKKILGLDIGENIIGVAIADKEGITIEPLKPIIRNESSLGLRTLKKIVQLEAISTIIVGYPLLNNRPTVFSAKVKNYTKKLKKHFPNLSVRLMNESFSTWSAVHSYPELKFRKGLMKDRAELNQDSFAAREILKTYFKQS